MQDRIDPVELDVNDETFKEKLQRKITELIDKRLGNFSLFLALDDKYLSTLSGNK